MTKKKSVTTLFLDIGGVLGTNGWDRVLRQRAAEKFGLDYAEMNERHHLTFDTYESGKLDFNEYIKRIVFYEPRDFSVADFKSFIFDASLPDNQMIELFKTLKSDHNLRVAVVSNEGSDLTQHRIEKFNLRSFVDFFIVSCFVHFRKPDRDIFRIALNTAQAKPEEVIYVEDRKMFVEVASGLGIRGLHHTSYLSTKSVLESYGLVMREAVVYGH